MRTIGIRDALREALHEEMARDDSVFVMGEDVIAHGGPYTVTQGIAEKWPDRIFETPIAEAGIVGLGVGAALAGMRPVVEIMYLDFVTCAMDEVVNQAAKMRYMTGGQASVPMVIRLPCGPARLLAAQHSQIMESWFMHVPGLQVVVPTTPYDAKGLDEDRNPESGPGGVLRVQGHVRARGRGARRRLRDSLRGRGREARG